MYFTLSNLIVFSSVFVALLAAWSFSSSESSRSSSSDSRTSGLSVACSLLFGFLVSGGGCWLVSVFSLGGACFLLRFLLIILAGLSGGITLIGGNSFSFSSLAFSFFSSHFFN